MRFKATTRPSGQTPRGLGGGTGEGPGGYCICPKCGYKMGHETGTPCNKVKCPQCDALMTREESLANKTNGH